MSENAAIRVQSCTWSFDNYSSPS